MSDHVRKQIRDAVVAKLNNLPTTEDRVIVGRTRPLGKDYEPTLLVYTTPAASGGQETVRIEGITPPRRAERVMMLSVVGHIQKDSPPDDDLDLIAAEVEAKLGQDIKLGELVKDISLASTISQVDANGSRHEGAIRLVYRIEYHTRENAPTTAV